MATPFRIVFMGTPEFAVPTLKSLTSNKDLVKLIAVYTQPDRPAGRGQKPTASPIKLIAQEFGLPLYQPERIKSPEEARKLADLMCDLVVVVAFSQIFNPGILNIPRLGFLNVHASLLPKYRGAAPIQYALLNGEKETGISIIKLIPKMDAGPLLHQKAIPIQDGTTSQMLYNELAILGSETIIETLKLIQEKKLIETVQNEHHASYAPKIKKEDGLIHWNKTGLEILRQIHAFSNWPGTFTNSTKGILKIHKAKGYSNLIGAPSHIKPGEIFISSGAFFVKCRDGWLELISIQMEGKKTVSSNEFLNGLQKDDELKFI